MIPKSVFNKDNGTFKNPRKANSLGLQVPPRQHPKGLLSTPKDQSVAKLPLANPIKWMNQARIGSHLMLNNQYQTIQRVLASSYINTIMS